MSDAPLFVIQKDYSKCPPLHGTPKEKPQGARIAIFSPKKQQPEIPNMLWRLGGNSVEFWVPYGDKVLTSPPLEFRLPLPALSSTGSQAKTRIKQQSEAKRRPAACRKATLTSVWKPESPLTGCPKTG